MKQFAMKDRRSELKKRYDAAVKLMDTYVPGSKQRDLQLREVERLHKLLMDEKSNSKGPTGDGLLGFAGSLLGIGIIVNQEWLGTITSKALPFVLRGRPR